jgi:hypothetical protein
MHHIIRTIVCSAAATAALGLAACGSDEGTARSAKAEFVSQADAICAAANRTEQAVVREGPGWHYGPKFRDPALMTRFTKAGRVALTRLRALEPPSESRATFDRVLTNIDSALGAIEAEIAGGGDVQTAKYTKAYESAYADLAVSAGTAGLTECQGIGF